MEVKSRLVESGKWEVKRLGDECELVTKGTTPTSLGKNFTGSGINFIKVETLDNDGKILGDMVAFIDEETHKLLKRSQLKEGDLLISIAGALGRTGIVRKEILPANTNQALAIARLKSGAQLDLVYVYHYLKTEKIKKHIEGISVQGAQANLSLQNIADLPIYAPGLPEQEAIAEALSDADALIESLETLLAKKRQVKQGSMSELLTGKRRLSGFSGKWEVKSFNDVLIRINAKVHQIMTSDYQTFGQYPVVDQGKELIIGYSDREDKRFKCPDGGVIVFGDHTCIIKFIDFEFLVGADGTQVLKAKDGQHTCFHAYQLQHKGITPTGYNRHFKFLKEREFLVPSLAEQTAIAEILSDMDAEIRAVEEKLSKARAVKAGMMSALLTGRVRLV